MPTINGYGTPPGVNPSSPGPNRTGAYTGLGTYSGSSGVPSTVAAGHSTNPYGIGHGMGPSRNANARGARLTPDDATWNNLMGIVNGAGSYSGGSGGSGGNGGAVAALMAQLNANKDAATQRYQTNKAQVTDLYGQLRDELAPNAGLTAQRYAGAQAGAQAGGEGIASQVLARQQQNDDQRASALGSLGVDPSQAASQENAATNEGLIRNAQTGTSWNNLMGVLSNAQQSRDQLDVQGATDAGIVANRDLTNSYEDFMRQIDGQMAEAQGSYSGGSGGSAGTYKNPLADQLQSILFQKALGAAGLGAADPLQSILAGLPAYGAALGTGVNTAGKGMSQAEILSGIINGQDPAGGLAAWKAYH